jgi:hypothetical protein
VANTSEKPAAHALRRAPLKPISSGADKAKKRYAESMEQDEENTLADRTNGNNKTATKT